jgi:hypothetical protein
VRRCGFGYQRKQGPPHGRPPGTHVAVPTPRPWLTKAKDWARLRAALGVRSSVSAPQVLLDSGVGGAGVDEGQARVNIFVVM